MGWLCDRVVESGGFVVADFVCPTPETRAAFGKAFVVCVLGGLGTVPGALAGGVALGMIESVFGIWLGPQNATIIGFAALLLVLMVRPVGLVGRAGYE